MPTSSQDLLGILETIRTQMPTLIAFLTGLMYLIGFALVLRGIYALKQYGEMRSMMSMNVSLKAPLLYIFSGTMLIFYMSSINIGLTTIFNTNYVTPYSNSANLSGNGNEIIKDLGLILAFIGYISFFRGWIILTQLGGQSAPPGTLGRAITHIIGGLMLVNVFQVWQIIKNTIGYGG